MLPDRFSPTQPHLLSNRIIVLHDPMYEYSTHALATRPIISRPNIYTRLNNDFLTLHYYSRPNIDVQDHSILHEPQARLFDPFSQTVSTLKRVTRFQGCLATHEEATRPTKNLHDPQGRFTRPRACFQI